MSPIRPGGDLDVIRETDGQIGRRTDGIFRMVDCGRIVK